MLEEEKAGPQENEEEKPEIYNVKKGENGFACNRRDFLVTAGAGAAAVGMIGVGVGSLVPEGQAGQVDEADESGKVSLAVEALGMVLVGVAKGVEAAWKISNQGKNPSPKAVLNLSAAHDSQFLMAVEVPEIAPGQTVEVPVSLTAPEKPGEYHYQWQLRLGDGNARLNEFVIKATDAVLAESVHPYLNSTDQTWVINNPDTGAATSYIHFQRLEVESGWDYVYVKNGSGTVRQTLTGTYSSGLWSSSVDGAVVQVQLTSDSVITAWGFLVDEIRTTVNTYLIYMPYLRRATPTPVSYTVCLCNTVELCTCNLVCVCDSYCSCDAMCSCVGYCSCNAVCTCDTVHYWYPN